MQKARKRLKCGCDLGGIVFIRCKNGVYEGLIQDSLKALALLNSVMDTEFVTKRRKSSYRKNLRHHFSKYEIERKTGINTVIIRKNRKQKAGAFAEFGYDVIIENDPEIISHYLDRIKKKRLKPALIFLMNAEEEALMRHASVIAHAVLVDNWAELLESEELRELLGEAADKLKIHRPRTSVQHHHPIRREAAMAMSAR